MACVGLSGVCSGAVRSPLELVSEFFGCSSVDAGRCLGRTIRPSGVWGPLNGYFEKVQRLLAPDDLTLAFLHTSYNPMNGSFVCFFQRLDLVVEAYIRGYNPSIVSLLAVLKIGRPILVPR